MVKTVHLTLGKSTLSTLLSNGLCINQIKSSTFTHAYFLTTALKTAWQEKLYKKIKLVYYNSDHLVFIKYN